MNFIDKENFTRHQGGENRGKVTRVVDGRTAGDPEGLSGFFGHDHCKRCFPEARRAGKQDVIGSSGLLRGSLKQEHKLLPGLLLTYKFTKIFRAKCTLKLKVIGDHVRAVSYLISDGVYPSNVGRGYVVRRLIRRVVRCGRLLGVNPPEGTSAFTPAIAAVAIGMGDACDPEIAGRSQKVFDELEREELRFAVTLGRGEEILADMLSAAKAADSALSSVW